MSFRSLSHNERVKINTALDSRGSWIGGRKALMDSYEWHGKKDDRPAYDVFLESERQFQEHQDSKVLGEKKASDMAPLEFMQALDNICGGGGITSFYEEFFGDSKRQSSIGKKNRIRFFSSREFRLEMLRYKIDEGAIKNVDDSEEIKLCLEKAALEQGLISEEAAAVIRTLPTPKFS